MALLPFTTNWQTISSGFQIEVEGTNFLIQKFSSTDVILIHIHPLMLYYALTHTSQFNCEVIVVMHLWATL